MRPFQDSRGESSRWNRETQEQVEHGLCLGIGHGSEILGRATNVYYLSLTLYLHIVRGGLVHITSSIYDR